MLMIAAQSRSKMLFLIIRKPRTGTLEGGQSKTADRGGVAGGSRYNLPLLLSVSSYFFFQNARVKDDV